MLTYNGRHNKVLLGQIPISNTRNKRVIKNNVQILIIKSLYMQIVTFISVSVSVIMHCFA